ncbi:MAG: YraN family protein [Proteobacteria bacterium]|nr:YraN family protein [Pseudomonadota bacterium]
MKNNFWKLRFGKMAEQHAMQYLKKSGYWIKHKNYRTKLGEIDLIATKGEALIFVEVKALSQSEYFAPEDHFNWKKRKKQILLGKYYLSTLKHEYYVRFDLITVVKKEHDYFIQHHENVIQEDT